MAKKIKNDKKLDEFSLSSIFGFNQGQLSKKDKRAYDIFMRDFVAKAIHSLDSAIQSELVDPNVRAGQTPATAQPSQQTNPQTGVTPIKEDKFYSLNFVFENIMKLYEADANPRSISTYLKNWFRKYTTLTRLSPDAQAQVDKLSNNVEATYNKDKGKTALNQMGNLAYALLQSDDRQYQAQRTNSGADQPANQTPSQATAQTTTKTATLEKVKQLVNQLQPNEKALLLKQLQSTTQSEPSSGEQAFKQMASQLANKPKARPKPSLSTGGTVTRTPTGIVHKASTKPTVPAAPVTVKPTTKPTVAAKPIGPKPVRTGKPLKKISKKPATD